MKTRKDKHVGLRLEEADLSALDALCASVGGASRSRVIRRLLQYLESDLSDRYTDAAGNQLETNHRRVAFVDWFRRVDDAMIEEAVEGIDSYLRAR